MGAQHLQSWRFQVPGGGVRSVLFQPQSLTVGLHDDAPRDSIASGAKKDYEENKDDLQGGAGSGTMRLSAALMHSTVFRGDFRLRMIVEFDPPFETSQSAR
jgi:hypothetical protein